MEQITSFKLEYHGRKIKCKLSGKSVANAVIIHSATIGGYRASYDYYILHNKTALDGGHDGAVQHFRTNGFNYKYGWAITSNAINDAERGGVTDMEFLIDEPEYSIFN